MCAVFSLRQNSWVPKEFGEENQLSRCERQSRVGRRYGEESDSGLVTSLELVAVLFPRQTRSRSVDPNVADFLIHQQLLDHVLDVLSHGLGLGLRGSVEPLQKKGFFLALGQRLAA